MIKANELVDSNQQTWSQNVLLCSKFPQGEKYCFLNIQTTNAWGDDNWLLLNQIIVGCTFAVIHKSH